MQATVLSIAGSDPTGGAGIQADLKTMTTVGVYGAAVVTCITVQNSRGVSRVEYLSPDLVFRQTRAVLEDHTVTHVKIGMVGTALIADAICGALADFPGEIVYDPVAASSTGQTLLHGSTSADDPREHLVSKCTVLTPNLEELSSLSRTRSTSNREAVDAARQLLKQYRHLRVVLVKGGHLETEGDMIDSMVCRSAGEVHVLSVPHRAVQTRNSHGTGCTFASAFASFHCLTGDDKTSFYKSVSYIQTLLSRSAPEQVTKNPAGPGCMLHYLAG
jgi:hydroxymethylpyrimidine/phosphomethylpyrimidine kinase